MTRTDPGMEAFDDWQGISNAPRDGSEFMGAHEGTGNVYTTWYRPIWQTDQDAAIGDIRSATVWWCRNEPGKVVSFVPTHWRDGGLG